MRWHRGYGHLRFRPPWCFPWQAAASHRMGGRRKRNGSGCRSLLPLRMRAFRFTICSWWGMGCTTCPTTGIRRRRNPLRASADIPWQTVRLRRRRCPCRKTGGTGTWTAGSSWKTAVCTQWRVSIMRITASPQNISADLMPRGIRCSLRTSRSRWVMRAI